jgi:hypothetical protein
MHRPFFAIQLTYIGSGFCGSFSSWLGAAGVGGLLNISRHLRQQKIQVPPPATRHQTLAKTIYTAHKYKEAPLIPTTAAPP